MAGPILANTAYAVADYVADAGIPTFQITGADDLTQRQFDPLVLRAGYTSSQSNFPAGQWAYDQGHRNAVTICPDYPLRLGELRRLREGLHRRRRDRHAGLAPARHAGLQPVRDRGPGSHPRRRVHRLGRWARRHPLLAGVDRVRAARTRSRSSGTAASPTRSSCATRAKPRAASRASATGPRAAIRTPSVRSSRRTRPSTARSPRCTRPAPT